MKLTITIVVLFSLSCTVRLSEDEYFAIGCFKDNSSKHAIGGDSIEFITDTVKNCYELAKSKAYDVFAIEDGTHCYTSRDAYKTFHQYGISFNCVRGLGGLLAMSVYELPTTRSSLLKRIHQLTDENIRRKEEVKILIKRLDTEGKQINTLVEYTGILIKGMATKDNEVHSLSMRISQLQKEAHRLEESVASNATTARMERLELMREMASGARRIMVESIRLNNTIDEVEELNSNQKSLSTLVSRDFHRVRNLITETKSSLGFAVKYRYPEYDAYFIGIGTYEDGESEEASATNLNDCLRECYNARQRDDNIMGLHFYTQYKQCSCEKRTKGHTSSPGHVRYNFV